MKRALTLFCALGVAAASAASAEQPIEGFGKDLPLSSAVQQIVPQGLSVSYGDGIDPSARVSWRGGADWQSVLRSVVVGGKHLSVTVTGKDVAIADADAAYAGPVAPVAGPTDGTVSPGEAAPPVPAATRGLLLVPLRHVPAAAAAAAPPPVPAPAAAAAPAPAPAPAAAAPAPAPAPSPPAAAVPAASRDTSGSAGSAAGDAAEPAAPMPASKPMSARQRRAAAAAARAAARADGAPAPAPAPSARESFPVVSEDGRTWHARAGQTLDQVLGAWADRAGWTLVFSSRMVYELQASADFEGDFTEAAGTLIRSVKAVPQPLGTFYRGNKVLVVRNHFDQSN